MNTISEITMICLRSGVKETERSSGVETGLLRSDQDRVLAEQDEGELRSNIATI